MNEKKFLKQLKKQAQDQAPLAKLHLFPSKLQPFTAWIWQHSWKFWLLLSLISAFIFEKQWGRC